MARQLLTGLNKRRLQRGLILFFLALAIPTAVLIQQAYSQLKWESFHQHHLMAKELSSRIDAQFSQLIDTEQQRSFNDYSFLTLAGDPAANFLQRSPLSSYPIQSAIAGVIGYFQVDSAGNLVTPLLPEQLNQAGRYGITEADLNARVALQGQLHEILSQNSLVRNDNKRQNKQRDHVTIAERYRAPEEAMFDEAIEALSSGPAEAVESLDYAEKSNSAPILAKQDKAVAYQGQQGFDQLNSPAFNKSPTQPKLGRIEDLELKQAYWQEKEQQINQEDSLAKKKSQRKAKSAKRTEEITLPEHVELALEKFENQLKQRFPEVSNEVQQDALPIRTFESEIDPFEFSQLASGHFVLFRTVWLNEQRYIQGLLIEQQPFLDALVKRVFDGTALAQMSQLLVVHQGDVLAAFNAQPNTTLASQANGLSSELLYQTRLSAPLSELQLLFSITQLPVGPGGRVMLWLAAIASMVLVVGFYLLYRLGMGQIKLANQQQDFVSAVSHELKTPLTSIRMYGEILKQGWATEEKKKRYYDFIFDESERLSRLINSILLMAKLSRNTQQADLKTISVAELMQNTLSQVSSQIEREGFELVLSYDAIADKNLIIDPDWFAQIMINLIDNAIKFSQHCEQKKIDCQCIQSLDGTIQFSIRDYGPGIAKKQMKKIFKLFYRSEDELTRETVGTGIGLALVHHMVLDMNGTIVVSNSKPGAQFTVSFMAQN
jgi:signal transduction histidine kinase